MKEALTKALTDGLEVPAELKRAEKRLNDEYKSVERENRKPRVETRLETIERLHHKFLRASKPTDDIYGTWHFDIPQIEEVFCSNDDYDDSQMVWSIHRPRASEKDIWGTFDQVCVDGILKFNRANLEDWKGKEIMFRWRGRETGENRVQAPSGGDVVFASSYECSGVFCNGIDRPWKFIGKKVSNKLDTITVEKCKKYWSSDFAEEYDDNMKRNTCHGHIC
jgi:hypothetical protein